MEMISWSNQSPDPQDLPSSPTNPSPAVTQPRKPRHRWTPSRNHLSILERLFKQGTGTPNKQRIKEIATDLVQYGEISEANVYNWFQNRKAKEKKLMSQSGSAHLRHDGEAEIEAVAPREKRRRMDIDEIINPRPSRLSQELEGAKSTVKTEADVDLDEQNAVTEEGSRDNICATNLEGKERRRSFSETDAKRTKTDENCDEEEVDLLLKLKDPVQDLDELCLRGGLPIPFYKVQSTPHKSTQYLYTATVQICTLRNERSAVGTPSVDYNEAKVSAASRMLGRLYLERSRLYSNA
uniref:Wuschel-like homeobox 13C n=1 Tax=Selaginella kraussiana TaxID=81964 RepID=A0A0P0LE40_9TRAC|nr:wuschel-like homeobox 13C [Selaginella kraussiana]